MYIKFYLYKDTKRIIKMVSKHVVKYEDHRAIKVLNGCTHLGTVLEITYCELLAKPECWKEYWI